MKWEITMNAEPPPVRYHFEGPVAIIDDPAFWRDWADDEAYLEELTSAADPEDHAAKRLAVDFQRALAHLVSSGRVAEDIDKVLAQYLSDDYQQHDAHLADGPEPLAAFFKGAAAAGIDLWPPMPIAALVDRGVVALLLYAVGPDGTERFIPTQFRASGGRLVEHWSNATPPKPPAGD